MTERKLILACTRLAEHLPINVNPSLSDDLFSAFTHISTKRNKHFQNTAKMSHVYRLRNMVVSKKCQIFIAQ